MSSIRQQILTAAIGLVNAAGKPDGVPTCDDTRLQSYEPEDLPALTLFAIREESETKKEGRWGYFLGRSFTLRVEFRCASDTPNSALDPLYVWIGQQLGGQQFPTDPQNPATNLAEDSYEQLAEWQYADVDQPYTLLQLDFRVLYNTLKTDPTRAQ